ncbi:hypothetical protein [Zhihengliuella halotolerans]|uniref:Phage gp6-like head-tail connector protein n=1 Tax=Zhihengliuella halotolerans TaxID=370736 RepID=A0A4Q8ACS8_9MICC|nr:hypothetical protein [Zhihengliuella halotolerans]RZU61445.1 hypothetical protein EV380_1015 [Zhihengliuella halotolerans]
MLTTGDLLLFIDGLPKDIQADDPRLSMVAEAVNGFVDKLPHIERDAEGAWTTQTKMGALLVASRLWLRTESPSGIQKFGDGQIYISKFDPEAAKLLNTDEYSKPEAI